MNNLFFLKCCIQIALLAAFSIFFGHPAIMKYQAQDVIVIQSDENTGGLVMPSISIFIIDPKHEIFKRPLVTLTCCKTSATVDRIVKCIEANTVSREEGVEEMVLGVNDREDVLKNHKLVEDFTFFPYGMQYTLDLKRRLTPSFKSDQFIMGLNNSFVYVVFVSEEKHFIVNGNPNGQPKMFFNIDFGKQSSFYIAISLTERYELNLR